MLYGNVEHRALCPHLLLDPHGAPRAMATQPTRPALAATWSAKKLSAAAKRQQRSRRQVTPWRSSAKKMVLVRQGSYKQVVRSYQQGTELVAPRTGHRTRNAKDGARRRWGDMQSGHSCETGAISTNATHQDAKQRFAIRRARWQRAALFPGLLYPVCRHGPSLAQTQAAMIVGARALLRSKLSTTAQQSRATLSTS